MKEILCMVCHDWVYNYKNDPDRRYCKRCGETQVFNRKLSVWYEVLSMDCNFSKYKCKRGMV